MQLIYIVLGVLSVAVSTIRCEAPTHDKTTEFLNKKLENYDKLERPYYKGKALDVAVSAYILDLFEINEKEQTFSINLYLRHQWKDPRLEFTEEEAGTSRINLSKEFAGKIWMVDPFIVNERSSQMHNLLSESSFTRLSTDGTVLVSARYTIKVACPMSLGWFPFDRHTCPIGLESYAYTAEDYSYSWRKDDDGTTSNAVRFAKDLTSLQFTVAAINLKDEREEYKTSKFSKLSVEFFFIRAATRYVHEIYLPALIITFLAFTTLIHATGSATSRLYLSIFLTGLQIILMSQSASSMPPVSYQTALDFYLVICLLTITFVVFVNVIVCMVLSSSTDSNGAVRLQAVSDTESQSIGEDGKQLLFETGPPLSPRANRIFTLLIRLRFVVPAIFVLFNVLYWLVVAIGSSIFPDDFIILESYRNT